MTSFADRRRRRQPRNQGDLAPSSARLPVSAPTPHSPTPVPGGALAGAGHVTHIVDAQVADHITDAHFVDSHITDAHLVDPIISPPSGSTGGVRARCADGRATGAQFTDHITDAHFVGLITSHPSGHAGGLRARLDDGRAINADIGAAPRRPPPLHGAHPRLVLRLAAARDQPTRGLSRRHDALRRSRAVLRRGSLRHWPNAG